VVGDVWLERFDHDVVDREQEFAVGLPGCLLDAPRVFETVGFDQRLSNGLAAGAEKGVSHRTANSEHVGVRGQGLEHRKLVGDLCASKEAQKRATRLQYNAQVLELALEQVSGDSPFRQARDDSSRGVRAVRCSEGVVDIIIGERCECLREFGLSRRFAGVEANVFEERELTLSETVDNGPRGFTDAIGRERHVMAQESGEMLRNGFERELGVVFPLRSSKVREQDHARAACEEFPQRRKGGANPSVVADLPVGERDVEVGAYEYAPTSDSVLCEER
jgi:hypothetical protein